ncbi:hypothetical protein SUDANB105_00703 [Streptomyces sp. enrichment culture]|uniref:SpaA isopeptide-forming pilin-related protein n=1 Tax=Streptomyces sp. enrichment culture TaxID=1795815 RepID=UPI003F556AD5
MHARTVRGAVRSAAVAIAVTTPLVWAPTATAQAPEPTPSASAATTGDPESALGSVSILKKDPAGDVLVGAEFLLLDTTGQEAGTGKTDAEGRLNFTDLSPGVYRLKETSSGSPLHDVVDDQDVIITPGATARLTIVDPFKPAQVLLTTKDDKTGKLLPGSTVNIGRGRETLLTLTTGPNGTATGELPVTSKKTEFWVKQTKAPEGYDLDKSAKSFTASPGAPVTVTVTNAKTASTTKPTPTEKPTNQSTGTPSTPTVTPTKDTPGESVSMATGSPDADVSPAPTTTDAASQKSPSGSLAHTGADATPWLLGSAGALLAVGGGAVYLVRRSKDNGDDDQPES